MPQPNELLKIVEEVQDKIKNIKRQPGETWEKLDKIVSLTVKEVEKVYEDLKGEDKKKIAEGIVLELYFKHFNLRWLPDFIERPLARKLTVFLVDKLIDVAVSVFNKTGVFKHS